MNIGRFAQLSSVLILAAAIWLFIGGPQLASAQTNHCPEGLSSRLGIGDRAEITPGPPSTLWSSWQTSKVALEILAPGSTVTILDGPECRNGITWWKVRAHTDGKIGWLGEGRAGSGYWLQKVELPADSVWSYGILLGTGSERILYDSAVPLTCEEVRLLQEDFVRGDRIRIYQLDESQQLVEMVHPSRFWLYLDESIEKPFVGFAFQAAQLASVCPGNVFESSTVDFPSVEKAFVLRRHNVEIPDVPTKTSFNIQVPRFEVVSSLDGFDEFNTLVDSIVFEEVVDFVALMQESLTFSDWNPEQSRDSYLKIEYYIIGQTEHIVSVLIVRNSDIWFAAHPAGATNYSINYDLVNDKPVILADLFLQGSDYRALLLSLIQEQIGSQNPLNSDVDDLLSSWNIGPLGLLLSFDTGEVGPMAAGPVRVLIPYHDIDLLLNRSLFLDEMVVPYILPK